MRTAGRRQAWYIVCLCGSILAARRGHLAAVRPLLLSCLWADIWLHNLCAAGLASSGREADAMSMGLQLPGLLLLALGLGWWEERFVSVLLAFCAVDACMYLAVYAYTAPYSLAAAFTSAALITLEADGPYLALAVGLLLWRRVAIRRARRLVADDLGRYAAAWATIVPPPPPPPPPATTLTPPHDSCASGPRRTEPALAGGDGCTGWVRYRGGRRRGRGRGAAGRVGRTRAGTGGRWTAWTSSSRRRRCCTPCWWRTSACGLRAAAG
jgi:hypothetical protein